MTAVELAGFALAVVNALLALVLGVVYFRNHRELRSPFTLGLLLFALFLLVHNALILYDAWSTMMLSAGPRPVQALVEEALQAAASVALVAATLR